MSDIVTELNKVAAKVGGSTNANTIKDAISNISVGLGGDGSATDISDALSDVVKVASAGGQKNGSDKVPEGSALAYDSFSYSLNHKLVDGDDYLEFVDGELKSSGKITWVYSSEGTEGIECILGTYPTQEDTIVNFGSPYLPESSLRSKEEYRNKRLSIWIGKKFAPVMDLSYYAEKGQVSYDNHSTMILFRPPYSKMPSTYVDEFKTSLGYMSNPEDFVGKTVELISPYTGTKIDDNNCYAEHVDLGTFSYESANGSETYHLGSGITTTQPVINGESSGNLVVTVSQETKDLLYSKEPVHNVPTDWTICIRRY